MDANDELDDDSASAKMETAMSTLQRMAKELNSIAVAADILRATPVADRRHFYAEAVRLAAAADQSAAMHRDSLIGLAARQPDRVSLPKLSQLSGVSVNTIRSKIGLNGPPTTSGADDPVF